MEDARFDIKIDFDPQALMQTVNGRVQKAQEALDLQVLLRVLAEVLTAVLAGVITELVIRLLFG